MYLLEEFLETYPNDKRELLLSFLDKYDGEISFYVILFTKCLKNGEMFEQRRLSKHYV